MDVFATKLGKVYKVSLRNFNAAAGKKALMIGKFAHSPNACKGITIVLAVVLILWTAFTIRFRLFITPPGETGPILITQARDYYFDKSDLVSKELKFRIFVYKDLWLSLPNVSDVVTTDEIEGADIDFGVTPIIRYATIDGQIVDILAPEDSSQQVLFEKNDQ